MKRKHPGGDEPEGRSPLMEKLSQKARGRNRADPKVRLHVISRAYLDSGRMEYVDEVSTVSKGELPADAVHVTGRKAEYAVIAMKPNYPPYADPDAERDEDGDWVAPHNIFDAFGYYMWYIDERMRKGEDALGAIHKARKPIEWQKLAIIGAFVLVAMYMIPRMMG